MLRPAGTLGVVLGARQRKSAVLGRGLCAGSRELLPAVVLMVFGGLDKPLLGRFLQVKTEGNWVCRSPLYL